MNSTLRFLFLLLLGISYHTEDFCKILKPILHLSKMDEATDKEINSWITDNPDPQSNEVQTFEAPLQVTNPATLQSNEASPQTETKGQSKKKRQSKPSAATQRERRRASDTTYRGKMEGKWEELRRNVPGCSKDLSKEKNIDKIIDCIHILRQRSEEVKDENKNLKERLKHQSVSPQPNSSEYNELSNLLKEHDPVNISSLFVGNPQESNFGSGAESQLNAPEASRDASLQPQEAPRSHERETERFLNGNEDDEDEPCDSNGMSGYQSAMALSSKKRKQREEMSSGDVNAPSLPQADEQNKQLIEKNEQLNDENTRLKEQIEMLKMKEEQNKHWKEEYEQISEEYTRLKEQMGSLQPQHQSVSLLPTEETAPVIAASSMPEGPQASLEISGVKATEATRDSSLQVQEPTSSNEKEIEAHFPSNEEANCGGNEGGSDLNGKSSDPSARALGLKKRKHSEEEAEVDQAKSPSVPERILSCLRELQTEIPDKEDMFGKTIRYVEFQGKEKVREDLVYGNTSRTLEELVANCIKDLPSGEAEKLCKIMDRVELIRLDNAILSMQHPANGDADAALVDLLGKINADEKRNLKPEDFPDLVGKEIIKFEEFEVATSLLEVIKKTKDCYGDVFATCRMGPGSASRACRMLFASIKEMNELQLQLVTEDQILKWSDAIKDASLYCRFSVDFAMVKVKEIACAFIKFNKSLQVAKEALRMF